jgi:hypothetical protein
MTQAVLMVVVLGAMIAYAKDAKLRAIHLPKEEGVE